MQSALWISKTGLEAQDQHIATIANNLANVNTTGYKKSRPIFEDLIYQNMSQAGAQSTQNTQIPTGINMGTGVRMVATQKNFIQGPTQNTDNPYNVSIQGQGFIQVLLPNGTLAYTRDGNLTVNDQNQLVTQDGYTIQPTISLPTQVTSISIGQDGTVSVTQPGNSTPNQVGQLQLANFTNPTGLQPMGQNLYIQTMASGTPQTDIPGNSGLGYLQQRSLEGSNVNVVEELVSMIQAQRSYEITAKGIQTVDNMLQYLTQTA